VLLVEKEKVTSDPIKKEEKLIINEVDTELIKTETEELSTSKIVGKIDLSKFERYNKKKKK
jgi:hypothetical protein